MHYQKLRHHHEEHEGKEYSFFLLASGSWLLDSAFK